MALRPGCAIPKPAALAPSSLLPRTASPLPPFHRPAAPAVSPNPSSAAAEGHHLPDLTVLGRHLKSPCKTHAVLVLSTGGTPSSAPTAQHLPRPLLVVSTGGTSSRCSRRPSRASSRSGSSDGAHRVRHRPRT
ncbi:hypothetical protein ZWY2020_005387 [Hordeum vulgare]|nr:hypothetical protein ZWY2020_005387 [Hordeum vulgare]